MKKAIIIYNRTKSEAFEFYKQTKLFLEEKGVELLEDKQISIADFMIVLGGDGTLLGIARSLNYSFKNSVHDGYELRMGSLAQKAFANDSSIIPSRNKSLGNDFKSFPYQLFNSLLEISSPREKLIYLLCGACSGRISLVLNSDFAL